MIWAPFSQRRLTRHEWQGSPWAHSMQASECTAAVPALEKGENMTRCWSSRSRRAETGRYVPFLYPACQTGDWWRSWGESSLGQHISVSFLSISLICPEFLTLLWTDSWKPICAHFLPPSAFVRSSCQSQIGEQWKSPAQIFILVVWVWCFPSKKQQQLRRDTNVTVVVKNGRGLLRSGTDLFPQAQPAQGNPGVLVSAFKRHPTLCQGSLWEALGSADKAGHKEILDVQGVLQAEREAGDDCPWNYDWWVEGRAAVGEMTVCCEIGVSVRFKIFKVQLWALVARLCTFCFGLHRCVLFSAAWTASSLL